MRVLDLALLFPGPYCSRILADFGFEVIKVERPDGGDWLRHIPPLDPDTGQGLLYCALNRGKNSLTLDLKSAEGREILLGLVRTAAVSWRASGRASWSGLAWGMGHYLRSIHGWSIAR